MENRIDPTIHPPRALISVFLYRQPPEGQPIPWEIPKGHFRVELVTDGRGWVQEAGEWIEVKPGDLLWHEPGEFTISRSDPDNPYHCLAVTFRVRNGQRRPVPRISFWPDFEAIRSLAVEAPRSFVRDDFPREALMQHLFGLFLFHASKWRMNSETLPAAVRTALDRMDRDFGSNLRISAVARLAGCSEPHLRELFVRHVGMPPRKWLIRRRIRAAKELLLTTADSVKEIAFRCGFHDAAALGHSFKAETGHSPAGFRRHARRLGP